MVRITVCVVLSLTLVLAGCTVTSQPQELSSLTDVLTGVQVEVRQEPGQTVYWILPGPRRLGELEWGTPEHPKSLVEPVIIRAQEELPEPLNRTVPELLEQIPILGGLPLEARATNEEGTRFTTTVEPTAVSDEGRIVTGEFHVTYIDRQPYDLPGSLLETEDQVEITARFTDPAGNEYELVVDRLWQPPIPGWETGGGVVTSSWIHGNSGTESPLFPRVFAWGAFWGLGQVIVNGEVVNEDQWIHFMTTQTVRDQDYRLVTQDELPLAPEETIAGQVHHTHVVVRPVRYTPDGPVFEPVHTAFELPNGQNQPFLHIMFEQDTIVRGPWSLWVPSDADDADADDADAEATPAQEDAAATPTPESSAAVTVTDVITVEGSEFVFNPGEITVEAGQEVTVLFRNVGTLSHNFTVGELDVRTETIRPGATDMVTFTPEESGTLTFWCDVSGHREAGMEGEIHAEP